MKIIGEKINGTRKRVAEAIRKHDVKFIQDLAKKQADAGSAWIDVNVGTHPSREADDLVWAVKIIQEAVDIPLCLDSANPRALQAANGVAHQTPMINSISGDPDRLEHIVPLVAEFNCPVIVLSMGKNKIPETVKERIIVIEKIVRETQGAGIADEKLYIDPLAMSLGTDINSGMIFLETMRTVHQLFPEAHFTCGLSNISFGLPARSVVNRTFLTLAMYFGLDSAILDPLDKELRGTIKAVRLMLAKDRYCLDFTKAYRAGLFD